MSFPRVDSDYFIAVKMSSHQASSKADHLNAVTSATHSISTIIALPVGNLQGRRPRVTNQSPCNICDSFSEEQQIKIEHRRQYIRKQKQTSDPNTSKDDLDLLGDDGDASSSSQADLEGATENLFSSPPRPQPLRFESLSLKTPQTVPPTLGTAL